MRVFYVSPPQPPLPVPEEPEEGSSPRASLSDSGNLNASDFTQVSSSVVFTFAFELVFIESVFSFI